MASSRRLFPGSLSGRDGRRQVAHATGADRSSACELCGRRPVVEASRALGALCARCVRSYDEPIEAAAKELRAEGRI